MSTTIPWAGPYIFGFMGESLQDFPEFRILRLTVLKILKLAEFGRL